MFDILLLAAPFVLLIAGIVFVLFSNPSQLSREEEGFVEKLKEYYLSVKTPIKAEDEKHVAICEMYIYPVRGIRAGS